VVALFAVEVSVDAGGVGGVEVLGDGVGAVPVAGASSQRAWRSGGRVAASEAESARRVAGVMG
jgi:hypothetical protein